MSVKPSEHIVVPSSPADRQKMKMMITEMTHCMQRIKDEQSALKDIAAEVAKQFDVPKKQVTKLAKTWFKRDYSDVQAEHEDFETLYESILETPAKE
jgi:energy-converting hydrogenase A subunit M